MSIFTKEMQGMLIYSPEHSARLLYILEVIFGRLLGLPYRLTLLESEYIHEEGPKLNYSLTPLGSGMFIRASGLLYEPEVYPQKKALSREMTWEGLPVLFAAEGASDLPFDLFAAAFYLVSRYEEYLPHEADEHERFRATSSIAWDMGFLHRPLVNLWVRAFQKLLESRFSGQLQFNPPAYRFLPTFDIDNAWAFKNKGLRTVLGFLKAHPMPERNYRYQVLRGKQPDPYDCYAWLLESLNRYQLPAVFFFLLARRSRYDRGVSPRHPALKKLIRSISQQHETGIHPSYQSGYASSLLDEEISRLERIIQKRVTRSRQHFIRLTLPETYRRLEAAGITEDFSMGYPDQTGYRASIGTPYPFFDLEHNRQTSLILIPFQVMDVTLRQYLGLQPEEAIRHLEAMVQEARTSGCQLTVLWHNESLSEWGGWKGWTRVYRSLLDMASDT